METLPIFLGLLLIVQTVSYLSLRKEKIQKETDWKFCKMLLDTASTLISPQQEKELEITRERVFYGPEEEYKKKGLSEKEARDLALSQYTGRLKGWIKE